MDGPSWDIRLPDFFRMMMLAEFLDRVLDSERDSGCKTGGGGVGEGRMDT